MEYSIGSQAHLFHIFRVSEHQEKNIDGFCQLFRLRPFGTEIQDIFSLCLRTVEDREIVAFAQDVSAHVGAHHASANPADLY